MFRLLYIATPVISVGFNFSPEAFWKSVIVLSASFSDSGLMNVRIMSSAYAVSLGRFFVGLGTGEMELLAWMWVMSGIRASIKRVGLNGYKCGTVYDDTGASLSTETI